VAAQKHLIPWSRLIDIRQWLKEILVVPYLRSNIRALHYVWAQTGPGGFATISLNFEDLTVSIHSRYRGQGAAVAVDHHEEPI